MSAQQSGVPYLWTYSGSLKIIEQVLNTYFLCAVSVLTFICTLIISILHIARFTRRSKLPWHWIECAYALISGLLFTLFGSAVFSIFTKGYIATGIVAYVQAIVYFFDAYDKYKLAIAPVPKYAWTTPNMPELE